MSIPQEAVEAAVLEYLSEPKSLTVTPLDVTYLKEQRRETWATHVRDRFPKDSELEAGRIQEACWSLLAKGLVYLGSQRKVQGLKHDDFHLILTQSGVDAIDEGATNPYNRDRYLARLGESASEVVMSYCDQAVVAFHARCWDAAVVMMGVAAEATFEDLARAFLGWRPVRHDKAQAIGKRLDDELSYSKRLSIVRDEIKARRGHLPTELRKGWARSVDGSLNLVREYRNAAGHPRQVGADLNVALLVLSSGAACLVSLYALTAHFEKHREGVKYSV